MEWNSITSIIENDLKLGDLRYFPKLTLENARPNTWQKMNVRLAAQTLSTTVALELKRIGKNQLSEFVFLIDQWFDLMNTGLFDGKRRAKPNLEVYKRNDENTSKRLKWLSKDFPEYFKNWQKVAKEKKLVGEVDRSKMLLSVATEEGLLMTTRSMVALIEDVLANDAEYVMTRRINQDPLESYFGHQRQRGRYNDAPTVSMFGYNSRSINCMRKEVKKSNVTTT